MSKTQLAPFADRSPTPGEIEKLRLILSTYQDGSGMLQGPKSSTRNNSGVLDKVGDSTLPGWRDFERAIAATFNGEAPESKAVFDVELPLPTQPKVRYGISCKMRGELDRLKRDGRVTNEVSNSEKKFWAHLESKSITRGNYRNSAGMVGKALIRLVEQWHIQESYQKGGRFDLSKSCYLILLWNPKGDYQLFQYPVSLPDPAKLKWSFPTKQVKGKTENGSRVCGADKNGTLIEWYGESGGQLKYYPPVSEATWQSPIFRLEPLPKMNFGLQLKTEGYFPEQWEAACKMDKP
jgi:hypothetical protein